MDRRSTNLRGDVNVPGVEIVKPKPRKKDELWLTTFADLSFILMSFFALLLSMSTLNVRKIESVSEQFKEERAAKSPKAAELPQVEQDIRKEIERLHLQDVVDVKLDAEGVSVEFKDQLLFEPGAAALKASYAQTAQNILRLVAKANPKYKVTIEGHTDDTPLLPGSRYPTNWELSAARGISLLNHLASLKIASSRMRVVSYADTQPKVSVKGKIGEDLKKARAANRRVVIRLE